MDQRLAKTVEYRNLHFLFYHLFKGSKFEVRFIRNHVVIYPRYYSSLYSNVNERFSSFTFGEGYNNFYSMISYINLMIPDEELVVDISSCPIIADHKVDPSQIAEMTFLDAIRIARERLSARVILEEQTRLGFHCPLTE